jgi:hypothetical protein
MHFLHFADGGRRKGEMVAEYDGRNTNNGREEVGGKPIQKGQKTTREDVESGPGGVLGCRR